MIKIWTPEEATHELMSVMPFLNRIIAVELRTEAGEGTTIVQFRALTYLLEGPLTLSALAKKRRVSLQSAGELVQTLVERGWIVRTPDLEDRRQWLLQLTDAGRIQHQHAQHRMIERLIGFMEKLSDEEMAAVQIALPALRRVLAGEESENKEQQRS